MTDQKSNDWLKDYEDFLGNEEVVPSATSHSVQTRIRSLLNPNSFVVFLKVLSIHGAVGFLSLSVCHQFGINPFNTERSLADFMMTLGGHHFCMLGCGILFVGLSILAAGAFLSIEEVNALKRTQYLQTLVLGLTSLGYFISFGAEFATSLAVIWLIGGFIGAITATKAVLRLKRA